MVVVGGVVIVVEIVAVMVVLVVVVPVLTIHQRINLCFVNELIDISANFVKNFMN